MVCSLVCSGFAVCSVFNDSEKVCAHRFSCPLLGGLCLVLGCGSWARRVLRHAAVAPIAPSRADRVTVALRLVCGMRGVRVEGAVGRV